jgi:hypothetical protein
MQRNVLLSSRHDAGQTRVEQRLIQSEDWDPRRSRLLGQ